LFATLVAVFATGPASAQTTKVFVANYDGKLLVDDIAFDLAISIAEAQPVY